MILGKIISIDDWVPERPPKPKFKSGNGQFFSYVRSSSEYSSHHLPPSPASDFDILIKKNIKLPSSLSEDILKQESEKKLNLSTSRRNSFAGQSSYSSKSKNCGVTPPAVPMRPKIVPTPIMTINSLNKDHHKLSQTSEQPREQSSTLFQQQQYNSPDSRIVVTKRVHNSMSKDNLKSENPKPTPPPRFHFNNNYRQQQCPAIGNEKYIPYKNSSNEFVNNIPLNYQHEIKSCNLPDVLPLTDVKYHNSYRQSFNKNQQLYSSLLQSAQPLAHTAPILNKTPVKSVFNFPLSSSNCSTPSRASNESTSSGSPLFSSQFSSGSRKSLSLQSPKYTSQSTIDLKMTKIIDPKLYTNEELIQAKSHQKEPYKELNKSFLSGSLQTLHSVNENDNKIAVVRKLNMVETMSIESLEEKSLSEKSEKEIKIENFQKNIVFENNENKLLIHQNDDDLLIVQKSEILVNIQPSMQEIACQTDCISTEKLDNNCTDSINTSMPDKLAAEIDLENLSKDLASQLSPSDKLHKILGKI